MWIKIVVTELMLHEAKVLLTPLLSEDRDILEEHHSRLYLLHQTRKLKHQAVSRVSEMGTSRLLGEALAWWPTRKEGEIAAGSIYTLQDLVTCQFMSICNQTASRQIVTMCFDRPPVDIESQKRRKPSPLEAKTEPTWPTERLDETVLHSANRRCSGSVPIGHGDGLRLIIPFKLPPFVLVLSEAGIALE